MRHRAALFLVLLLAPVAWGQEVVPDPLTSAWVQERLEAVEKGDLPDADKAAAVGSYKKALEHLAQEQAHQARGSEFLRLAAEAPSLLTTIREELARPLADPRANLPQRLAQLEQELTLALGEQRAAAEQVEQLGQESRRRADRRRGLPDLIAQARQRASEAAEPLASVPEERAELTAGRAAAHAARRQASAAEVRALEQEQAAYDARDELLPARRDRAQRRQSEADRRVSALQEAVSASRRVEAERVTREQAERLRATARDTPLLAALAAENHSYAERRSGAEGVTASLQAVDRELASLGERLQKIDEQFVRVRRRVEAAGLTQAMGLLLRRQYEALPDPDHLLRDSRQRLDETARVQVELIELEEVRASAGDVESALPGVLTGLGSLSDEERAAHEAVARELLTARRELLDTLIPETALLFQRLVELDGSVRALATLCADYRAFIEERILWTRSVSGPLIPSSEDVSEGVAFALAPSALARACGKAWSSVRERPGPAALVLIALLAIFGLALGARRRSRNRDRAPTFGRTLSRLLEAVLVAAPVPAALTALAWFLAAPVAQHELGRAFAAGLEVVALYLLVFGTAWRLLRDRGPGKTEFHWSLPAMRSLRAHLLWFVPVKLACELAVGLYQHQGNDRFDDALGRGAFVVGMLAMAVFLQRLLRTGGPLASEATGGSVQRLRVLWYPLAVGVPLGLAVLATVGYYYTALRFAQRLETTLLFVLVLVVVRAVLLRWLLLERRRMARAAEAPPKVEATASPAPPSPDAAPEDLLAESPAESAAAAGDAPEAVADSPPPEGPPAPQVVLPPSESDGSLEAAQREQVYQLDMAAVRAQTQQLFNSLIGITVVVGLLLIWNDVLPALKRLDQLQVWPRLSVLEEEGEVEPVSPAPAPREDAAKPTPAPPLTPLPMGAQDTATEADAAAPSTNITLADVGLALLLVFLTFMATKNLPGLLEILVLSRLPVDVGVRYAATSISRYLIVIVGGSAAFNALGITWGSVQWLAAALTFGLAFGLQEIFANFVSGLIILFERPVRVGDVVTVNGINGRIARIRIRATTIQDWNGKELIIPNKEFVTGQVINWTLTEARVRLQIPIGIAYGSDAVLAQSLLLQAARAHPSVLDEPAPHAMFEAFGDSVYQLELRVHLPNPGFIPDTRTELLLAIKRSFEEHEIEIAFPQRDLHIRSASPVFRVEHTTQGAQQAQSEAQPPT